MNTSLLVALALLSAVIVHRDASRHAIPGAFLWAAAVFLFWIIALPAYIFRRSYLR